MLHPCASRLQLWHLPEGARPARWRILGPRGGGSGGAGTPQGRAGPGQGLPCHSCSACRDRPAQLLPLQHPALSSSSPPDGAVAGPPEGTRCQPSPGGQRKGGRRRLLAPSASCPSRPSRPSCPSPAFREWHRCHSAAPAPGRATRRRQDPPPGSRCCSCPARCPWRRAGCSWGMSSPAGIPALPRGTAFPRSGCLGRCRS